jgi:hypothetical protein
MPISIASIKDIDNLSVLFNQYQKFYGKISPVFAKTKK